MVLKEGYGEWLDKLKGFIETEFGEVVTKTRGDRSIQFTFKGKIDVDLLVSPYWEDKQKQDQDQHELYRFLNGIRKDKRKKKEKKTKQEKQNK